MIGLPTDEIISEGERGKAEGMALASIRKRHKIIVSQLAFLDAIAASPDGLATTDDATTDLRDTFADGGKWRGNVVKELAFDKLIEKEDVVPSTRPARHRGYVTLWRILDRHRIDLRRAELRRILDANPSPSIADGYLFDDSHTIKKPGASTPGN